MKKIITMIVVLIIIVGLGFGGFWLYKKMNTPLSSELEKIEINPDERKELVETLDTTEDKMDMIIQLIEDINYDRIFYNDNTFGTFTVKDKYKIEYIVDGTAVGGYDYMDRHYVAGGKNAGIMWVTGSNMVYVWSEYKKECTYRGLDSTVVELAFEDELLFGKYNMGYESTAGNETYYLQFSEKIKNNKDEMKFSEKDSVYNLTCKKKYANGQTSSFDDFVIETDGITYIHIKSDYAGKLNSGKDYYRYDHYIEINNKELFEKIIAPIKGIKEFPEFKVENQTVFDALHDAQSKYDHEQLMADYIASVEPKDQTWTVDKVENFTNGYGITSSYNKGVNESITFMLSTYINGVLCVDANQKKFSTSKYFGITNAFNVTTSNTSTIYKMEVTTNDVIYMYNGRKNGEMPISNAKLKDFKLNIELIINQDTSCSLKMSGNYEYKDENEVVKTYFDYTETISSYTLKNKYYDCSNAKWQSKINSTYISIKDENNNTYIYDEKNPIIDTSENHLLDDGTTYSNIVSNLLGIVLGY